MAANESIGSREKFKSADAVAILDAGAQYVDLIQKACERLGYRADILPLDTPLEYLQSNYAALITSGGPGNSQDAGAAHCDPRIGNSDMPQLGICYGMHEMVVMDGGRVERGSSREDGRISTKVDVNHPLFHQTKQTQTALFTHGNFVTELPEGYQAIGEHVLSDGVRVYSAIAKGENKVAVQFHPEAFDDTPEGFQIFTNFLSKIAGIQPDVELVSEQIQRFVVHAREKIKEQSAGRHVIAFVSGGVDSSVATKLAATEVEPNKLHAYYIDNGFMRVEDDQVIDLLSQLGVPIEKVDAQLYFQQALSQIIDPQEKRKLIGRLFVDVQNQILKSLGLDEAMLLQGTNAADRIESGFSKGGSETALIKSHHNQVQEIQDLKQRGLLIEPLDELFKDEVRSVGRHLGLPEAVVERQPFPGPGLAIRILCADTSNYETIKPDVDQEIQEWLNLNGYGSSKSHLLPIRNVGVGGDERSHVAAVALESSEDWQTLSNIAFRLTGVFRDQLNRVIVALDRPLGRLSITSTMLDNSSITQLRQADRIVFEEMRNHQLERSISQFPVVLLPLSFHELEERSIVLRPFNSPNFMTGRAMLPGADIPVTFFDTVAKRLCDEVNGISQVFLDLTNKPPGTTEWE